MRELYGDQNGYGWQLGEIVSAQTMYVPADDIYALGKLRFQLMLGIFSSVLFITLVAINLLLKKSVISPIQDLEFVTSQLRDG